MAAMPGLPLSFSFEEFGTLACLSFGKSRCEELPAYIRVQVAEMTELGTRWIKRDPGGRIDRTW